MRKPIIIGNWKAHKSLVQAQAWAQDLVQNWPQKGVGTEIVLAPSFIHLAFFKDFLSKKNLPIKLSAQDVSASPEGAYTGEVTAPMLSGLSDYVLIGHSERRNYFKETEEILKKKVERSLEAGLKIIYCVSGAQMAVPEGVTIVGYEPLFAIGSGKPDNPENANRIAGEIKSKYPAEVVYGGSVKPDNAQDFIRQSNIDGLLIGGASLKAQDFLEIIKNAV